MNRIKRKRRSKSVAVVCCLLLGGVISGGSLFSLRAADNTSAGVQILALDAWKPALGCRIDKIDGVEALRQTLPPDFTKGNHAWSRVVPTVAGAQYRFHVRYQLRDDVKEAFVAVQGNAADGTALPWNKFRLFSPKISGTENNWKDLTYDFTAFPGSTSTSLGLRLNSPGTVFWDNPTLEQLGGDSATAAPAPASIATPAPRPSLTLISWESGQPLPLNKWKPALGCRLDKLDGTPVLRQTLPPDFTKGNHSWSLTVPTQAGAKYRFRVQYQLRDEVKEAFAVFLGNYADGSPLPWNSYREFTPKLSGVEMGWKELKYEFAAPPGSTSTSLGLRLNSPGTVFWSEPVLELIAAPPQVSYSEGSQPYEMTDSVGVVAREVPLDKLEPLHVKWLRCNIGWAQLEGKGPGQWDEQVMAKIVEQFAAAKRDGFHIMVSLGYPPAWAARKTEGVPGGSYVAKDLAQWQEFIAFTVTHLGDEADCYRIMNEPDHQWDTGRQPVEYTQFLKTAYDTIKKIRPSATVVMAGISGTQGKYFQDMYDAGAKDHFDVAACQPYMAGNDIPEEGRLVDRLRAYRMVMAANGDNKPLWVTETGYPAQPAAPISDEEQAALCVRSYLLAMSSEAGVTKLFFYLLRNEKGDSVSRTGGFYETNWTLRPLGKAISTMAEVMNPMKHYVGDVSLGNDATLYNRLFKGADGNYVWAVWCTSGQVTMPFDFKNPVKQTTWDGTVSEASGTTFKTTIDIHPVFFSGDMPEIAAKAVKQGKIGFEAEAALQANIPVEGWTESVPGEADWDKINSFPIKAKRQPAAGEIARAKVIGAKDGLYLRVEINEERAPAAGSVASQENSIELFANLNPEQTPGGYVTEDCYHFVITPDAGEKKATVSLTEKGGHPINTPIIGGTVDRHSSEDGKGSILTTFIPWNAWTGERTWKSGSVLGFDLAVNRFKNTGEVDETGVWFGGIDDNKDSSLWGSVRLGAKP